MRIVIDTDPGVDDAHAIMMALAYPDVHIEALTTVVGNVPLERTTANALTILDIYERDIPVYAGCSQAIIGHDEDASHVHGEDGLGNSNYPASARQSESEHAVNALVRMANDFPGELTLVAIGPLTNVAMATRLDPSLPVKYKRLVVMGGAIRAMGNTKNVSTEFNLYSDPEAGAIVFDAWKDVALVSWETTMAYPFSADQIEVLGSQDNARSEFFNRITQNTVKFIQERLGRKMLFAPDPLAVAVALEPDIVTKSENHFIQVEMRGEHTRGQTTVDWSDTTGEDVNAEIILEVDSDRLWELMKAAVN
ncbi:MAG: nucleoside hydrolase [Anaerolineales bacterium]